MTHPYNPYAEPDNPHHRSKRWFTANLCLGDPEAARRRLWWGGVDKHDDLLAKRWDAVVGENDLVYVLGCVFREQPRRKLPDGTPAFPGRTADYVVDWLRARPGRKMLVSGVNYGDQSENYWLLRDGFDAGSWSGHTVPLGLDRGRLKTIMTAGSPENARLRPGETVILYNGGSPSNGKRARFRERKDGVQICNVRWDFWGRPVSEDDVLQLRPAAVEAAKAKAARDEVMSKWFQGVIFALFVVVMAYLFVDPF